MLSSRHTLETARGFRLLADFVYGRNPDGTFSPGTDRYFLITAADQAYERVHGRRGLGLYLDSGNHSWGLFDHTFWNTGYTGAELRALQPALERRLPRAVPSVELLADGAPRRYDLRPGDAVPGRAAGWLQS